MPQHRWQAGEPKHGGRKKGTPNKTPQLLKQAILLAAENAGGGDIVTYLTIQAIKNPVAFLGLLGRVLPLQVDAEGGSTFVITRVERVLIDPKKPGEEEIIPSVYLLPGNESEH